MNIVDVVFIFAMVVCTVVNILLSYRAYTESKPKKVPEPQEFHTTLDPQAQNVYEKRTHAHVLANLIDRFLRDPNHVIPNKVSESLIPGRDMLRKWGDPTGRME